MTLLVLLLFITIVPTVNRYDVIEHNTFCDEDGREVMQQWIAWDWASIDGVHRCQWWTRASGEIPTRTADGWRVTVDGRRIVARWYRETRTRHDPEVEDRSVWPIEKRRGVKWASYSNQRIATSAARRTRPKIAATNATACTATTAGRLATMTFRLITAKRVGT